MPARSQPANSISDDRGTAGDLNDDIGRVGMNRIMGGRQDGDTAKPGNREQARGLSIHNDDFLPTG